MISLLHISASPRGDNSESLALADVFLGELRVVRPDLRVETYNLWDGTLPPFGPAAANAKMSVFAGQPLVGEQAEAWEAATATYRRFAAADAYLFSVPMWNHGVPYILKQFIDVVSQPGMLFTFDPDQGYSGLLTGKRAAVIYTSAVYGPGRPPKFGSDFHASYFNDWLRWAGLTEISEIHFRPNVATPDAETARRAAREAARTAGHEFLTPFAGNRRRAS
jgi:FMN-dependent NADH-azoreductase